MSTIFTKIIQGEIPSYKIYEDDKTFAFLDINPESLGHTLVVPKVEVDKLYDLDDDYYTAVMSTAKKLASHFDQVLGTRTLIKVIGTDVPHAHVHLVPFDPNWTAGRTLKLSPEEMESTRAKLALYP